MKVAAVGLEVNDATFLQEITVAGKEQRGSEAFLFAAYLRIGEGYPDFRNFFRGEKGLDKLYPCTEEGHIGKAVFCGIFCAFPEPCTLDVNADIVAAGIAQGKVDGIFAFAAAKLDHYGTVIAEHLFTPMPFQWMVFAEDFIRAWLDKTCECLVFLEFPEFVLSHYAQNNL